MAEAASLCEALTQCQWMQRWLECLETGRFVETQSRLSDIQLKPIMKEGSQSIVDRKSVFDLIHGGNLTGVDKKASLELLVCKDALLSLDGELRWVPHELNPSDSMTKSSANHECLLRLLQSCQYSLRAESEIMEERKQYRDEHQRSNPRPKKSLCFNGVDTSPD
eukprot:3911878-Amphidinium_carterae.1